MKPQVLERLTNAVKSRRPLVFAHRGCSEKELENTLPAFIAAAEAGSNGIELDVQLSRDDRVVVFHDRDLRRLAGGDPRAIRDCTAAELRNIPPHPGVPLLEDVLNSLPRDMIVDVELKSYDDTHRDLLVRRVAAVLTKTGTTDRVLVSSFDPRLVRAFRRAMPAVPTATIFADDPELPRLLRRGLGVVLAGATIAKPSVDHVLRGRRPRRRIYLAWTVATPGEIDALVARGAAGVITNDPAAALAHLSRRGT